MRYEEANIEGVELRGTNGIFQGSDGRKYRLALVDRRYEGKAKPAYYLQREGEEKLEYLSGVFPTKRAGVWSMDLRDAMGVKHYFDMEPTESGFIIKARKSDPWKGAADSGKKAEKTKGEAVTL